MKNQAIKSVLLICIAVLVGAAQADDQPNIVIIMSDDMGFSDIGCYGGEIQTPNLDSLASNGIRFTQFYNAGRCCPTRASLLTGLYPHQAGIGHMMNDRGFDGYRGDLNSSCQTIAEVLRPAGYSTYMAGKWHVTPNDPAGPKHNWPLQRGFDRFYGTIHGGGSFFDPVSLTRGNEMISPYADPEYQPETYYYTDAISDHAVRFINDHATNEQREPFFLYVSYTAAHWPMHALPKDIAKYRGKYDAGFRAIRDARLERSQELGIIDPEWTLTAQADDWSDVEHKVWDARNMEVYAAMVDNMDQGIGRIVTALRQHAMLDNTLVIFLQDNGGCAEAMGRKANGELTTRADGPTLVPLDAATLETRMIPKQTRDGYPIIQGPGILAGPADTFVGYGRGWANVSNTPFREYKHWVHEGGIATPLIAHWPRGIPPARHGTLTHQPAHLIDLMATCIDLAGASYPASIDGHAITPLQGVSLRPAFEGEGLLRTEPIFWEHEGNRAMRDGKWKLVAKGAKGAWELYDMEADRTETNDLSQSEPQRTNAMAETWEAWALDAGVKPWPYGPTRIERVYKRIGDVELSLFVYQPSKIAPEGGRAAVVFFHGGGWTGGQPSQFFDQTKHLANHGIVGISAAYRLGKTHGTTPYECVADGKSAMRWVREHAAEFGIDPQRIAAGGGSAGGHIAAAIATTTGFDDEPESEISCLPNALILFNPVFDNGPDGFGHSRVREYWQAISPLHNIKRGIPPSIVFLGTEDSLIPVETARRFEEKVQSVGSRCDLRLYEGQGHGFFNRNRSQEMYDDTVAEMDSFLRSLGWMR